MARRRGAQQAEQAARAAEAEAAKVAWALEAAHDQQRARDEKLRASQATVEAMRLNRCVKSNDSHVEFNHGVRLPRRSQPLAVSSLMPWRLYMPDQ